VDFCDAFYITGVAFGRPCTSVFFASLPYTTRAYSRVCDYHAETKAAMPASGGARAEKKPGHCEVRKS